MMNRIRHFENLHVLLWLIKDTCWLTHFKLGGTIMIFPTVFVAFHLAWKTRRVRRLFLPNVAVCFWICANVSWMLGEFYAFNFVWLSFTLFVCGIAVIVAHYLPVRKQGLKEVRKN